jgi:hypothetical protein
VRRGAPGCCRIFQNIVIPFNFYVLFFQTATKLLGQIVINSFTPNYVINRSVREFLWSMGAVIRERLGIAELLRSVQTVSRSQPACYSIGHRAFSLEASGRVLAADHTPPSNAEDNNL